MQSTDDDFSPLTLIPTVVLSHEIPDDVNRSWYRGQPYVFIKVSATEPSSALRNAAELKSVLIARYGDLHSIPPIIVLYADGGPEHPTSFLSVKIAVIALQKSLKSRYDCSS